MAAVMRIDAMLPRQSGAGLALQVPPTGGWHKAVAWLARLIFGLTVFGGRLRLSVDNSLGVAATGTVTLTQASLTAGDHVGIGSYALTAVTGAADASLGQWSKDTSNAAAGISLAAAINGYGPVKALVSATDNGAGVVTITSRLTGAVGNGIALTEKDASGGIARSASALAGGVDPDALRTILGTFSGVGTANDTITIGGVVLTLKAAAANENEITIGGTAAITATNAIAVINANSKLKGFVLASSGGSAIVSLQLLMGGRIGHMIYLAENGSGFSWAGAAANFAPLTTDTWALSPVTWSIGSVS